MNIEEAIKWFEKELEEGKCSSECEQCNANELALHALKWIYDREYVYCTKCKHLLVKNNGYDLSCPHENECYFWNQEDSMPRYLRRYYEPKD